MKNRSNRDIKIRRTTISEFKTVVRQAKLKSKACITISDKKHAVESCVLYCGTFSECYELCASCGIKLISYEARF